MMKPAFNGLWIVLALSIASCHDAPSKKAIKPNTIVKHSVNYVSADNKFAMTFSDNGAKSGYIDVLQEGADPETPLKRLPDADGVACVSVGWAGNSEQFAIKRPITNGQSYKCLETTFKVERCFERCSTAIVKRDTPLTGGRKGTLPSYMLVDRCSGMLALSPFKDMANGIPLDAVLLRGAVGILADKSSPGC